MSETPQRAPSAPLLDPRLRHQTRDRQPPAQAPAAQPIRVPPGGRGHANAGVVVAIQQHATTAHLRDMSDWLGRQAQEQETR